jgi:Ca2+-binding RTX toxin-like protein
MVTGTARSDLITPGAISGGVTGMPGLGDDSITGSAGNDTIDAGPGFDLVDYQTNAAPLTILLNGTTTASTTKPDASIDTLSNVERIAAGTANDLLTGFAGALAQPIWLRGNAGNDTIDGASNRDIGADYSNSPAAINVALTPLTGAAGGTARDGWGGIDTLINVRRVIGTRFNDTIVGGAFGDVFVVTSAEGAKTLNGNGSSDRGNELQYAVTTALLIDLGGRSPSGGFNGLTIKANGLTDTLMNFTRAVGGTGNDTILGTWGDDTLQGGAGDDTILGRSGGNTAAYAETATSGTPLFGARVDLTAGTARDPWGGSDVLVDIQSVQGSALADALKGRDLGFTTRSLLAGGQGNDTLTGAGAGFTAADYNDDPAAVDVQLGLGQARDGWGGTDMLVGINAARGSAFGDVLTGGAGDDVITGGNGRDTMAGGTGADRFGFSITSTRGAASSATSPDLITDYTVLEGDQIRLSSTLGDVVWRGFTGFSLTALVSEVALGGQVKPASPIAWFIPIAPSAGKGGWLAVDENGDGTLQMGEFAVRLDSAILPGQFSLVGPAIATIFGDSLNNVLTATGRTDGLRGLDGSDTLYGSTAIDNLVGGGDNDTYVVRNAETVLVEGVLEGDRDVVWMAVPGATLSANVEEIRLIETANLVTGANTDETIVANSFLASTIYARGGDDVLWGGALADTLDGGDGDDIIRGQAGADRMFGGLGNDQFVVNDLGVVITELLNSGTDTAWVAVNGFSMPLNVEIGRLSAPGATQLSGSEGDEDLVANIAQASLLNGNGGNDVLWGSAFADTINGGLGDDILRGQGGNDVMAGGAGNDQYVVFAPGATVSEAASAGRDIVYFAVSGSFALGPNIEEARLVELGTGLIGGDGAELLVGNSAGLASAIRGNGGDDVIWGTAAGDTLTGGAGNDILYGQRGADIFRYDAPGWGFDQIGGFAAGLAKMQFTSSSGVAAFGQLALSTLGGNTTITHANGVIQVFGVTLTASDVLFG